MKMGLPKSRITITSIILIFIFFIFSDVYPLTTSAQEDMFKQLMKEGNDLYEKSAYDNAIDILTDVLSYAKSDGEQSQVYLKLSLAHFASSRMAES